MTGPREHIDPRLQGRTALVTGGAKGLGLATARALLAQGARVVITDIDVAAGRDLERLLGDQVLFLEHDVSSEADWDRIIDTTLARWGHLDVLVNNAGIISAGNVETETLARWRHVHEVIVAGAFLGCRSAVLAMKDRGGAIVNVASIASLRATPATLAYGSAKAAVEALTRSVALHCSQWRYPIRCNSVHPGPIDTAMVQGFGDLVAAAREDGFRLPEGHGAATSVPAPAEEIAEAIVWLASDAARGLNGTRLVVDRGLFST